MAPLKVYKLPDGTTRQYREGEQPEGAVLAESPKPAAKAPAKRRTAAKKDE